jgi:hypothetical protein
MTAVQLAERTRRVVAAAVAAGRALGLHIEHPTVLHDAFSVVVHLAPEPVVARIPVVLPGGWAPGVQAARQQRELDVAAWLADQGVPVVAPAAGVPRVPVQRDGHPMTFWELEVVADNHQPYLGVDLSYSAELHARLRPYGAHLPFLFPFNIGLPDMLARLDAGGLLRGADIERARAEYVSLRKVLSGRAAFAAAFPGATVQAVQGDAPSHNVIRTVDGIRFADFEDVSCGPAEWDLALMGPQANAAYDAAARERGLRPTNPEVQEVMNAARRLQLVGCVTLIPQLPILAEGLAQAVEDWRAHPLSN